MVFPDVRFIGQGQKKPKPAQAQNEPGQRSAAAKAATGAFPVATGRCRENSNRGSIAQNRWRTWSRYIIPAAGEISGLTGV